MTYIELLYKRLYGFKKVLILILIFVCFHLVTQGESCHSLSKTPAAPIPVPIHIDINPYFLPVLSNSWNKVTTYLAPVIPKGWPIAIAPPLGFNFSLGIPNFSTQ